MARPLEIDIVRLIRLVEKLDKRLTTLENHVNRGIKPARNTKEPLEINKDTQGPKCNHPETYLMMDHECEACRIRRSKQKYVCPYCDGNHKDCSSS